MTQDFFWSEPDEVLVDFLDAWRSVVPRIYREDPKMLEEHVGQENSFRTSGYSRRQVTELVQNAADAIFRSGRTGRIKLVLTDQHLYCANDGQEFRQAGIDAITHAYLSDKRGEEIGRYGLGFKSVLAVTDNPQVFSRSVSFHFGAPEAQAILTSVGARENELPILRLPTVLNAPEAIKEDAILQELIEWATTIVRLPLQRDVELEEQLLGFQTQFLIFTPHVEKVSVSLRRNGTEREIEHSCQSVGRSSYELQGPRLDRQKWAIFKREHHPSLAAREEVDDAIARKSILVTCAMPLDSPGREGEFWANFPLSDRTSAVGIFNAPWALSEDRSHILSEKRYNVEIFDTLAQLFVDSLPELRTQEQPARHLRYLPSRPQEFHSPADRALISNIHRRASEAALIPDTTGRLRHGTDILALHYGAVLPASAMAIWAAAPHTPENVPHVSCYEDDRSGTVRVRLREIHRRAFADARALLQRDLPPSKNELSPSAWLSMLGDVDDVKYSQAAIEIIPTVEPEAARESLISARIIPTNRGRRVTLNDYTTVHLPPAGTHTLDDYELVVNDIANNVFCRRVLGKFGFKTLDAEVIFTTLLSRMGPDSTDRQWEELWDEALNLETRRLILILSEWRREGNVVKVQTRGSTWRDSERVFDFQNPHADLPWPDRVLAPNFLTKELIEALGVVTGFSPRYPVIEEPEFAEYRTWAVERARVAGAEDQDSPTEDWYFAEERGGGPIGLLHDLSKIEPQPIHDMVQLTAALIRTSASREWNLHSPDGLDSFPVPAPHLWAAMTWGVAKTSLGAFIPAAHLVSPLLQPYFPWVPLPADSHFGILPLAESVDEIDIEILLEGMRASQGMQATVAVTRSLANFLCKALPRIRDEQRWTGELPAVVGPKIALFQAAQIFLASQEEQVDVLKRSMNPYLFVESEAVRSILFEHADFQDASSAIRFEVIPQQPAEPVLLIDCIPPVSRLLDRKDRRLTITECSGIVARQLTPTGTQEKPLNRAFHDGTVYVTSDPSIRSEAHNLLVWINQEVGLKLSAADIDYAVQALFQAETNELRQRCRSASSNEDRLKVLVSADQLNAKLPPGLTDTLQAMGTPIRDGDMAGLFLDSFGTDSLSLLTDELRARGLTPPDKWGGLGPARRFVRDLGFSPDFAGTSKTPRPSAEVVMGKPGLGALHDYQQEALRELRFCLRSNPGNADKALLELPTGAGKTRVAVESLVKAFLGNDFGTTGPVLWVAQSEELCEQAIITWSEVWREFSDERSLSINRFFGTHRPQAPELELSVVVATDAMLYEHIDDDSYDWIYTPVAVIVDEAHRAADNKMYRRIFQRLGVDLGNRERPLIGLSATPYRGRNPEVTSLLAKRFGNNLVQTLGADPIKELQDREVLARIDHQVLPGSRLNVGESEIERKNLSQDTLNRVGEDQTRTAGIVNHIMALPEEWKVLVFMPSVLSSQVLATILKNKGVEAKSVSGRSSRGERAKVISDFKTGSLQVLVNCELLTQGFDAPQVRALYVARPTLSESQYVQMVGRGLRGPKNRGSDRCLVVNLEDTIANVDVDLAYRGFTQYWRIHES
ncbi:superfamily II DNA or RNA helicase [Paenarthrobacter nicotinovorans]|uniref:DEAD/DEAH box helicase n=1 Tax=Paenarthrobacter nicotinovorans TaxID=29320 RepID=UPI00278A7BB3|nr:DEAD/DEAH box helicase family protein [Paenarthrobacter nicotinovorans]MDP9934755.1 superfamily II DNA or RNA helicase [Paenarthrobacter nicotinovorans]